MRKIFLDTNIILDLIERDATGFTIASFLYDSLLQEKKLLYCSPTTVAITYYYFEKFYRQKKKIKESMTEVFRHFNFTTENHTIVKAVLASKFSDVEDAIQYFSAMESKADVIITKNVFDYIQPNVEVLTPELFIEIYL